MKQVLNKILFAALLGAITVNVAIAKYDMDQDTGNRRVPSSSLSDTQQKPPVDFVNLAVTAFNAKQGVQQDAQSSFDKKVAQLSKYGYKIRTIEGEAGRVLLMNALKNKELVGVFAEKGESVVIAFHRASDLLSDSRSLKNQSKSLNSKDVRPEETSTTLGDRVRSSISWVGDNLSDGAAYAKSKFVSGFQSFRRTVGRLLGIS